jgi:hypothetical protein
MYVLFPLLVHGYKFLNRFVASEIIVASTSTNSKMNNFGIGSLYDLMETNEEMALSVVKKQLSNYKIRKEECKSPLAWWKAHESQFSYVVFVAQKFLGIFGPQN